MKKLLSIFALTITAIISLTITAPQVEASTYSITFVDNQSINTTNGNFESNDVFSRTNLIAINNNIISIIDSSKTSRIYYFSSSANSSYISFEHINGSNFIPTIPNNATHFAFMTFKISSSSSNGNISFSTFQTLTVNSTAPTPYTIQQKDPFAQHKEVKRIFDDYSRLFWHDDDGILRGTVAGEDDTYANRTDPFNLSHEMIYLNIPLPANITEAGTYDLWFTLYDYNDQFVGTYRPTSNNISTTTLSNLGAYYYRINYTQNYKLLPSWELFYYAKYNSQNAWLETFYNTNGSVLIQLHVSPTNLYQPQSNLLFVPYAEPNTYDIRDYLTANNIALPTKEGHTLLGFQRDLGWLDFRETAEPFGIETSFVFAQGSANKLYYPIFEQNLTYDVTFTDFDDTVIETVTVQPGETAIPTQLPTRTGYVFAYWEPPVTDIQGNLTTKAVYYVPITWRNTDFATIRIDQVIEGQMPSPPTLEGYTRTWTPTIVVATEPTQYILVSQVLTTSGNEQTSGVITIPDGYSPISDLFGGVIGASIGAVMTLGTIDLYGIQLSSIIYLFVSMSLGLWILKAIRG